MPESKEDKNARSESKDDAALAVRRWRIAVDTGGTFTDCIAIAPSGERRRVKVLSSSALRGRIIELIAPDTLRIAFDRESLPGSLTGMRLLLLGADQPLAEIIQHDPHTGVIRLAQPMHVRAAPGDPVEIRSDDEAPVLAARIATGTARDEQLPPMEMRLATTRGTNALLQRAGARTALVITKGFADLLDIGDQQRPDLFALHIEKPKPLHDAVLEVDERLDATGATLRTLDVDALITKARAVRDAGVRHAAVCLLHSDLNPDHERRVAEILHSCGFDHISCSSDLAGFVRILPRARTCVVNAYLAPVIESYLDRVEDALDDAALRVMTSAGGMSARRAYQPKDSLLSGPAGGVVGARIAAERCGYSRAIAFDMGGTSTDVARIDKGVEYLFEHSVGDARILAPAIDIHSVAAGGGSICALGAAGLGVGPASAGAAPGPACYGAGGPLTISDINLLSGLLLEDQLGIPIDRDAAHHKLEQLRTQLTSESKESIDSGALLDGLRAIANDTMADAIGAISTRRGYDPADHALVAFGGAGGQHACAVAQRLGMKHIIAPADAGLLSAVGLERAALERFAERQVLLPVTRAQSDLERLLDELAAEATKQLEDDGASPERITVSRRLAAMRAQGQASTITIEIADDVLLSDAFTSAYAARYGHTPDDLNIEVESLRVICSEHAAIASEHDCQAHESTSAPSPTRTTRARFAGVEIETHVYRRDALAPTDTLSGPAIIAEDHATLIVEEHWQATVTDHLDIILHRSADAQSAHTPDQHDAIRLELFTNALMSTANNMGAMLERTALSTNVKERLDFSCTLLSTEGELVVNAPHMPVHLGAMGLCVRALKQAIEMRPGDAVLTNHPAFGGSHLPDLTIVSPVHNDAGALLGYVATRAHHAEIGGKWPGSMPAQSTSLAEEGVVISPMRLVSQGRADWDALRTLLADAPWPSREIESNLADARAMLAANARGAEGLRSICADAGHETALDYMRRLLSRSERLTRDALAAMPDGSRAVVERLDDGAEIHVTVTIRGDSASIDFAGTSDVHPHGFNAPEAVVRSAILYVLRLLIDEPLPLNEGIMRAVDVRVPEGMLNPKFDADPAHCPPVAAGNVETSQRVVDALLRAFDLAACSQGTMNNFTFGDKTYGYYETICGGAGAGPGFKGADAVHTHMTNTRITDPELIERRYPVRLERFQIRRNSGGKGAFCGGDGVIREFTFLAPAQGSLLSQHRIESPYGLHGGADGACGAQRIIRADGTVEPMQGVQSVDLNTGDRVIIETPGAGAWGDPKDADATDES